MTRVACAALLLALCASRATAAQTASAHLQSDVARGTWGHATVRYGKWLTAAGAVALTWMGAREHARSAAAWDDLLDLCRADNANCVLGANGRYLNAIAEAHYQTSLHFDRRARVRLLGGQGALLLSVGLFVIDLRRGKDGPENIPFPSLEVDGGPLGDGAWLGLRFAF